MDTTITQDQYSEIDSSYSAPSYFERNKSREWALEQSVGDLVDWYYDGLIGDVDCDLLIQEKTIWQM